MSKMDRKISWKYYNHAIIPDVPPHVRIGEKDVDKGKLFSQYRDAYLIRWTENYDCGAPTNYWYVIKDEPFDILALKAKRRYEVNKGKKNFTVRKIEPYNYKENLFSIVNSAFSQWPEKYRPKIDHDTFIKSVESYVNYDVLGLFYNGSDELVGFALVKDSGKCLEFNVLRVIPEYEKLGANSGAVVGILEIYQERLKNGAYILDGARSVLHETNFQDYLEKYFGFRKVYCTLSIKYRRVIWAIVQLAYPVRKILSKFAKFGIVHKLCAVLKLEEYRRKDKKIARHLNIVSKR